jgi:hypothetical protein
MTIEHQRRRECEEDGIWEEMMFKKQSVDIIWKYILELKRLGLGKILGKFNSQ